MPPERFRPKGLRGFRPRPATTLVPPFLAASDLDYSQAFAALAAIELEIRRDGVTPELVLRRGYARFALGNYLAATFDAESALRSDPMCTEARFLKGTSMLALAAVKHGIAAPGIGPAVPPKGLPPRRHLLLTARESFQIVLAANSDDEQARRGLAATAALLADLAKIAPP